MAAFTAAEIRAIVTAVDNATNVLNTIGSNVDALSAKFNKLGDDVDNSSQRTAGSLGQMEGLMTRMLERLAILYAFHGVIAWEQDLIKTASTVATISDNLEISIGTVDRWTQATKRSGDNLNVLTNASDNLIKKLAKGDGGLVDALKELGLSWDQVWSADAGERIEMIAAKLQGVTDKVTRSGLEFEIFGTDKVDGALKHLKEISEVMDPEVTAALAADSKAMDIQIDKLKKLAAGWLDAARNAAAYTFGKIGLGGDVQDPNSAPTGKANTIEEQVAAEKAFIDLQLIALRNNAAAKAPGTNFDAEAKSSLGIREMNAKDLAAIKAEEKQITDAVHQRIQAEEALRRFEEIANKDRLKQLSEEYNSLRKIEDSINKKNFDAETEAKTTNAARYGQKISPFTGEPMRIGEDNQWFQLMQRLDELKNSQSSQFGPDQNRSTKEQQKQILDDFLQKQYEEAVAADAAAVALNGMKQAADDAAAATTKQTSSIEGLGGVLRGTTDKLTTNLLMDENVRIGGINSNLAGSSGEVIRRANANMPTFASGGPTEEGPAMVHGGEYVVPSNGALVIRSGSHSGPVHVSMSGILMSTDPNGLAIIEKLVTKAVGTVLRQGSKLPSA